MKKSAKRTIVGIIPCRGGSKGIPGKNIKDLCGKPLLAWTIETAKKSKYLDRIILTTDDEEIAGVGREYGAEVPFMRPKNLAGDDTPDFPVFEHALQWFEKEEGFVPDVVVHLRVTGPLRKVDDIDQGIKLLLENEHADSVRAVLPAPLHPMKTYRLENNILVAFIPEHVYGIKEPYNAPRQALPAAYAAGGYFSAIWSDTILKKKSMTGDTIFGFEVDSDNVVDIDTPIDFELARMRLDEHIKRNSV